MSAAARAYERSIPAAVRAAHGVFYTPSDVADRVACAGLALLVDRRAGVPFARALSAFAFAGDARCASLEPAERARVAAALDGVRVVDPSCGAGALLAAAGRAIDRAAGVLGVCPRVVLIGTDRDAGALDVARRELPGADLAVADALALRGPRGDLVLTNPPYGAAAPSSGDVDRYVTFWRAAAARVRADGALAVLAPTSWRTGARYAKARDEACGAWGLRHVVDLPPRPFADAYVDTCIAVCAPGSSGSAAASEPRVAPSSATATPTLDHLFASARGVLAATPALAADPTRVRAPRLGPRASARAGDVRLLVGRVAPFAWPSGAADFTRVAAADLVEGRASLAWMTAPRLLVRRIVGRASRLTCLVTRDVAAVKKDFYVLVPRGAPVSLEAYAALLHARPFAARLARTELSSRKFDFAQASLGALRRAAVPLLPPVSRAQVAAARAVADVDVDPRDLPLVSAWLAARAAAAASLGHTLLAERAREVDADPRWDTIRAPLDRLVARLLP